MNTEVDFYLVLKPKEGKSRIHFLSISTDNYLGNELNAHTCNGGSTVLTKELALSIYNKINEELQEVKEKFQQLNNFISITNIPSSEKFDEVFEDCQRLFDRINEIEDSRSKMQLILHMIKDLAFTDCSHIEIEYGCD